MNVYIDAATRSKCAGKAVLITGGHRGIGPASLLYLGSGGTPNAIAAEIMKAAADARHGDTVLHVLDGRPG